ncbi:MAG: naringenin-chalcone synthase [Betaproteobacteria bacterium]|nr:naringenin-chalcone synthase [Betaproteobacteria bacterium]
MHTAVYLSDFNIVRPRYEKSQEDALAWLAHAHAAAEVFAGRPSGREDLSADFLRKLLNRFGCSPDRIARRGHELADFTHTDWSKMEIFRLHEQAPGLSMEVRQRIFDELVFAKCEELFSSEQQFSSDLIHVSCTGYVSPSPLQRFVVERGFASKTRVTHAYHMGCYAALPASRTAAALALRQLDARTRPDVGSVDIVHTELCTLHFNPLEHSPEQLVVQSLFADGFVRYRATTALQPGESGFRILAMNEIQIPASAQAMTWIPMAISMAMTLSRDVPNLIAGALKGFVGDLFDEAGFQPQDVLPNLVYAVHPGGPKIIDHVQTLLEIADDKVQASRNTLKNYGNMSSATLPHVWQEILSNPVQYPCGTKVLSLAFGPGLTIAGALFEVVR